jgi:hypothetical protein
MATRSKVKLPTITELDVWFIEIGDKKYKLTSHQITPPPEANESITDTSTQISPTAILYQTHFIVGTIYRLMAIQKLVIARSMELALKDS